jgi:hypothetical protein
MRGARGCAAEKLLKSHGLCRNRCLVSVVDVGCNKIDIKTNKNYLAHGVSGRQMMYNVLESDL